VTPEPDWWALARVLAALLALAAAGRS